MVVRMRHNRSQVRQRRSHHALTATGLVSCSNCGKERRPHHMCLSCGFYRGRMVVDLSGEAKKRADRIREKKERIQAESGGKDAVLNSPENPTIEEQKDK